MSVYDKDNFAGRVNYAASVIANGGTNTRHFDTCFEMWDGDAVAAAVYKRSLKNAKLAANLPKYLSVESTREAFERLAGQNLREVAAKQRAAGEARFNASRKE